MAEAGVDAPNNLPGRSRWESQRRLTLWREAAAGAGQTARRWTSEPPSLAGKGAGGVDYPFFMYQFSANQSPGSAASLLVGWAPPTRGFTM